MNFLALSGLINFLTSIAIAIVTFLKTDRSIKSTSFVLLNFSAALFSLAYFFWQISILKSHIIIWFKVLFLGIVCVNLCYLIFVYSVLDILNKRKLSLFAHSILSLIFIILSFFDVMYNSFENQIGLGFWPKPNFIFTFYLVYWFYQCFYGAILLFNGIRNTTGIKREQIKYFLIAAVFGFSGGATNWPMWYGIKFPPYFNILIAVWVSIEAYAIIRYRLMDIKLVISRATTFIFVYSLILGLPIWIGLRYIGYGKWIFPMILMGFFATVGPFIYLFIQKKTEDALLQEQRRYQTTLRQASAGMGRIKDLKKLLNLIVYVVTRAVRLEHALVYIYDDTKCNFRLGAFKSRVIHGKFPDVVSNSSPLVEYFSKNTAPVIYEEIKQRVHDSLNLEINEVERVLLEMQGELVFPILIEKKLIAIIVLGKKESLKSYTQDDLSVFSILANQAALAIENAQFYEDMKKTQEQLFQAEKMATIGTMADGLSHQINNRFHALGFIAGDALDTLKMCKDEVMSDKLKEMMVDLERSITRVQENVVQGGEVVQGLLKYTRKGESGFTAVDFDKVFQSALEMAQFKIKTQEILIIKDYNETAPKIKGNFTQLQEVFFNLIDNGYDAMMQRKAEKKEIGFQPTLKLSITPNDDGYMWIVFEDNGMGVKEEDMHKLFTPFFTTKLSSKKGTGLGLYVIKKIIEDNHKGRVEMISKFMVGTQMKLRLPIAVQ